MSDEVAIDPEIDEETRAPRGDTSGGPARRWLLAGAALVSLALLLVPGWLRRERAHAPERPTASRPGLPATLPARDWDPGSDDARGALPPGPATQRVIPGAGGLDLDAPAAVNALSSTFECVIEPYELVEIGSPVRGVIEELPFDRSDRVEAGQTVVRLESGVEQASVELAQARAGGDGVLKAREASLELGERRRKRAVKLYARRALSEDLLDQADTDAAVARLELEQARETRLLAALELEQARQVLRRRSIVSPIAGVVVDRMMSEGETVDDEKILTIAQLDPLRVEVILPSAIFGSVTPGMVASVTPELAADRVHVAEVERVDRVIDPASGTFGVRLLLPNPEHAIPSGLHCQVRFLPD